MIKLINAQTNKRVIGKDNVMPWNIKEELAFFKSETINHSLLMGRKTFEGIGKVLPNRTTYLLTSNKDYEVDDENVIVINEVDFLFEKFKNSDDILFIAGGQTIYEKYYKYADELVISYIKNDYDGDSYFPIIDLNLYKISSVKEYSEFTLMRYIK